MLDESSKPWWTSKTVWSGVATIGAALASAAYSYFSQHDTTAAVAQLQIAWPGAMAIYGRLTATQRIGPEGQSQPQV